MTVKKVQLYLDRDKTIEASPETSANCVILSDGNDLQKVLDNDLTTPTVIHEETSFKAGVGDIDVSSSAVDGEVGRMVVKGQSYQNILPEPSLRNSMTNGKTMQKINEGYDNVEVVDGVAKSAILSGQTLVNLATHSKRQNINVQNLSESNGRLTWDTTGSWGKVGFTVQGKPNTAYCIKYSNKHETLGIYIRFLDGLSGTTQPNAQLSPTCRKFTTDATGVFTLTLEQGETTTGSWIQNPMILEYQEGMENWGIPYFTGMTSCKLPVLTTVGKNLWDNEQAIMKNSIGTVVSKIANGFKFVVDNNATGWQSNLKCNVAVKPNTDYTLTFTKTVYTDSYTNPKWGTGYVFISGVTSSNTLMEGSSGNNGTKSISFNSRNNTKIVIRIDSITDLNPLAGEFDITNLQLEEGSTATSYEPHKSNILTVNEDIELRGIGDVKDELNCMTGEYVQRIGEMYFDGSDDERWNKSGASTDELFGGVINIPDSIVSTNNVNIYSNRFVGGGEQEAMRVYHYNNHTFRFFVPVANLISNDVTGFKQWLKNNPTTIQYELGEKPIKTVDLSSSGNWEKVVLDGSENWSVSSESSNNNAFFRSSNTIPNNVQANSNNITQKVICDILTSLTQPELCNKPNDRYGISLGWANSDLCIRHESFPLTDEGLQQFKQYLSQNPITVWYQTQTHKDSTQVKQPIFFKDGYIRLSSGADNSLIPTLDYQAKTSNSYIMDLMKTNTRYTMKAKSASGTFTIDGTSYGAGTNGTFTTPSSMTNKLLVMSNKTNEEVMILEGDMVSKAIPYFKDIKSAFEDESKIEVLSTGKNLFDMNRRYDNITNAQATVIQNVDKITVSSVESGAYVNANFVLDKNFFKGKTVVGSCLYESDEKGIGTVQINYQDTTGKKYYQSIKTPRTFTFPDEFVGEVLLCVYANNTNAPQSNTVTVKNIQLELGTKSTTYDSHKSNVSKIPLLSPLRSLPNGVCDELIIDRMKKKATLIQRVGHAILGQGDGWGSYDNVGDTMKIGRSILPHVKSNGEGMTTLIPYTFNSVSQPNEGVYIYRHALSSEVRVRLKLKRTGRHDAIGMQNWLRENNIGVVYQLATPVVTEIDLENFPLVYKDGHVFLNSEIAPVVEIDYNINQSQQIQSNNETLQRHELDILDLDNLIVSFVNAEYNLRLLKFDMEMSMMALAE